MKGVNGKKIRRRKLLELLDSDPLLTDEEIASLLGVSVSTVRLDRAYLGIPELRERMRQMAQRATSRLRSLSHEEVVGELIELEPNSWALSVLYVTREMAFRNTDIIWDHYIYSQASSLAMAVIDADIVVTGSARVRFKRPVYVGDKLVARAKVGKSKGNKYIVSVRTRVKNQEVFVGRFIMAVFERLKDKE